MLVLQYFNTIHTFLDFSCFLIIRSPISLTVFPIFLLALYSLFSIVHFLLATFYFILIDFHLFSHAIPALPPTQTLLLHFCKRSLWTALYFVKVQTPITLYLPKQLCVFLIQQAQFFFCFSSD